MFKVKSKDFRRAIKAFIQHVESLENAEGPGNNGFEAEYKVIQEEQVKNKRDNAFSMDVGKTENNLKKNRYKDILPYDKHRVVLSILDGDEDSGYINASKLMGVRGTGGYIATQGPLPSTVNDFWRMIWEYNVEVIFMACRTVEMGKIKCKQYWHDLGLSDQFGDITIHTETEEKIMSDCVRRNFRVVRGEEERHVMQYHYSGWPDHGIPDDAAHIKDMIGFMRQTRHEDKAPLLVHCSAGCGRTGAIIAIDYVWTLLEEGLFDETFNLFDLICKFREQRMSIVQTADQYALVNKVLKSLCEEWLHKMASHTYENVQLDEETGLSGDNADLSSQLAPERNVYVNGSLSNNSKGESILNTEKSVPEQEHNQKKTSPFSAYANLLQSEGKQAQSSDLEGHKEMRHFKKPDQTAVPYASTDLVSSHNVSNGTQAKPSPAQRPQNLKETAVYSTPLKTGAAILSPVKQKAPLLPPQAMKPPSPVHRVVNKALPENFSVSLSPKPEIPSSSESDYSLICEATTGYETINYPQDTRKYSSSSVETSKGKHPSISTCIHSSREPSLNNLPGFNERLPRVKGPVQFPQAWNSF